MRPQDAWVLQVMTQQAIAWEPEQRRAPIDLNTLPMRREHKLTVDGRSANSKHAVLYTVTK